MSHISKILSYFSNIFLYLTRQVSEEQILIYNDGLGTAGQLPCSGTERQIFTLSAQGFESAALQLLAQRSNLPAGLMLHEH